MSVTSSTSAAKVLPTRCLAILVLSSTLPRQLACSPMESVPRLEFAPRTRGPLKKEANLSVLKKSSSSKVSDQLIPSTLILLTVDFSSLALMARRLKSLDAVSLKPLMTTQKPARAWMRFPNVPVGTAVKRTRNVPTPVTRIVPVPPLKTSLISLPNARLLMNAKTTTQNWIS